MAVEIFLSETFPALPTEIRNYMTAILTENADLLTTTEEIVETIGEHIQGSVVGLTDEMINDVCDKLMRILHEGKDASNSQRQHIRKLDGAVDMSANANNKVSDALDSIWINSSRNATTLVNKDKLDRANAKAREKLEKRTVNDPVRRKLHEIEATASQASNRRDNKLESSGRANSKDIKLENIDVAFGMKQLLKAADLTLVFGRRYGLIGRNGIGKTTLMKMISNGNLTIPSNISLLSVEQEVQADDSTVIDSVLASDNRRQSLLDREAKLQLSINCSVQFSANTDNDDKSRLTSELSELYQEMQSIELDKAPAIVASILSGLGFSPQDQKRPTKEFSGGWRMRLALAAALFISPDLLLLDEPTNMLDMKAIFWLENHLQTWTGTILIVSHDRHFLNFVCTDLIHLHSKRLDQYRGNYDVFAKTMNEKLTQQQREYEAQQQFRKHAQAFIDKFRYNAKRASMVQSRIKMLEKLPILEPIDFESRVSLKFADCELLGPPVLQLDQVSFGYSKNERFLFDQLSIGSSAQSRICIVGENGTGKSTLLKLLLGDLEPSKGFRNANRRLKVGYFAQHHVDQFDMDVSSIEVVAKRFPGRTVEEYRASVGRFGLSGDLALQSVVTLSGGQKSRLAFALIAMLNPNYLILDEPTNHLDVETVEALGHALCSFKGGVVLVSHDERLIEMVCKELWVVNDGTVVNFEGGLEAYKKLVFSQLEALS